MIVKKKNYSQDFLMKNEFFLNEMNSKTYIQKNSRYNIKLLKKLTIKKVINSKLKIRMIKR